MSFYHYRALDATGETVSGLLEADSVSVLENRLRTSGIWLLEASEGSQDESHGRSRQRNSRAKRRDVITFFIQISLLLKAGITLPNALARLGDDLSETTMGKVVQSIGEKVEVGMPLHTAMEEYPRVFSPQVTSMVQAGEVSGNLPEVFHSLSGYFEWLDNLNSEVRQATIYPVTVILVATAFVLLLFTLVVPKFVGLLTDMDIEIPALTQAVMSISNALVSGWPVVLVSAIGIPLGIRAALRSPRFALSWDRAKMLIPVFGPLVSMFAITRFARNLGMLYRSGITLPRALEISRGLVGNRAVEAAVREVHSGVLVGNPMSRTMLAHEVFPKTLVTMVATGESSGSLDSALESVAGYYNSMIPRRIKVIFSIFNPAIMILLIAVVGTVALSVVLPILQLWNL